MKSSIRIGNSYNDEDIHLVPNENLYNGSKVLSSIFGRLNSMEIDLLNLTSGIYAADLAIKRKEREEFIRTIELNVEVTNYDAFERTKKDLTFALHLLSKDNWRINFIQKSGEPLTDYNWKQNEGAILLFSGGIDSMCGAVKIIEEEKDLVLVSHITHGNSEVNQSIRCSRCIAELLQKIYRAYSS